MLVALLSVLILLPPQSGGSAAIEGRVLRSTNGEGVVRATVLLAKVGGQLSDYRTTVTNETGAFTLRGVPAGRYRVYAQHEDYLGSEHGQFGASPTGEAITLKSDDVIKGIDVILVPTSVITGRVSNDEGDPVRGVWVYALRPGTLEPAQQMTRTDDLGEYRIFGLTPGAYVVSAVPPNPPRIEGENYIVPSPLIPPGGYFREIRPAARTAGPEALVAGIVDPSVFRTDMPRQTYYPRTTDANAAVPVDVRPGATASGIDLRIIRENTVEIRGRVLNSSGQGAENVSLSLARSSGGSSVATRSEAGANAGVFVFPGVPPGDYEIRASASESRGRLPVMVGSQNLENVVIALQPVIKIQARARVEGRAPEQALLRLQLLPSANYQLRHDEPIEIESLGPGEHHLLLETYQPQLYVKSVRLGSTEVRNALLQIDRQPGPLEIVLSPNGAKLSGEVVNAARRPAAGARVALVPEPGLRTRIDLYKTATTDNSGKWELQGIAPGEYRIFAWERIEANAWQHPDVIRLYESQGTGITLRERDTRDLYLRVIPAP